ncbi:bifunctional UDP-N-acetylglucosamine diphosphorylase/glucosamine-1-phosphate N-acetyltransferase GlmU [Geothrix sp. PMB-07]|uniref:bifunctional UDP-N-acetylglucosamine diphosphorylase/glucosamine-1-phosphate N-acetyltransferase GlmU n=1 Tax=Geothrix sp. PMB-07 TaxID=3068640 RepID=UPI002740E89D|nr:bifunctional UDP-N-acetylglucosamine diphosphorylase/glucosamine-1-phosphate N-acetyltransferase GlmU [Geothrix sp. PMB-07]WLT33508.1 bifunctional UDP-N-acetylglucosamine diphosphorylase/glucosamine-1-phosphate N-acetyltransferase GlmU [Geothrix sp. PMB-07]
MSTVAVILAAGLGTRMKSRLPKVLHPILGDPSLLWVLRTLPQGLGGAVVVVHHGKEQVVAALEAWQKAGLLPCPVSTVDQGEPLGTGHAVQVCIPELDRLGASRVVILSGDVPLTTAATVARLCAAEALLLAMDLPTPGSYGRVLQHGDGRLAGIVEAKDATPAQLAVQRVNGGAYALPWPALRKALLGLTNDNAQKEYYLTDAVAAAAAEVRVAVDICDPQELAGMNSRMDQAELQAWAQRRIQRHWMAEGVTFLHPDSIQVGPRVTLDRDVFLEAGVTLEGAVRVGEGTRIGQGTVIADSVLGAGVEVRPYCVIEQAQVGNGAKVGPFARLREGTDLGEAVHIGNFVETKKAKLHRGAKANHLAYLGDAEIGEKTNIGAGVITCNYDGVNKHKTSIGRNVFVGSDTQLVAPVTIGDGALIGAGTTVTADVPGDALALSRVPQTSKEGGAARIRARQQKK